MINRTLKHLARACGLLIVRDNHAGAKFIHHPPRSVFDLALLRCFPSVHGLNFIQIGANDGQRIDPLLRYIDPEQWSGLMFEPVAANFAALQRRHGSNPRLRLRRMAVDRIGGHRAIYDLDRAAHPTLPDWAYGLASFDRDRVLQAARELALDERSIVVEEVATVTWDDVWREFGPARCDVLVLDTEGYDLTLLRAAGLEQRRPRLIHFEHACVGGPERLGFYSELLDLGYELATDGPDTTAWLPA